MENVIETEVTEAYIEAIADEDLIVAFGGAELIGIGDIVM